MPGDQGTKLREAVKALQDARREGDAHPAETLLERALLSVSAADIEADKEAVAAAVRLLRAADDNGTTRLEVRDQAMTRRRWFEVDTNGNAKWGDR